MSDENHLEARLRALNPAEVRAELMARLQDSLDERLTAGDRIVAAWTGLGAMAAAMIVSAVLWQVALTPKPQPVTAQERMSQRQMMVEYEKLLAGK